MQAMRLGSPGDNSDGFADADGVAYRSPMRTLRHLVKERLKALNRTQEWFAERVGVLGPNLSQMLSGTRSPPYDNAAAWATELGLAGDDARELEDAMHIAAGTPRARELYANIEIEIDAFRRQLATYRDRVGHARLLLDHIEPLPPGVLPDSGVPPDANRMAQVLLKALEDAAEAARRSAEPGSELANDQQR